MTNQETNKQTKKKKEERNAHGRSAEEKKKGQRNMVGRNINISMTCKRSRTFINISAGASFELNKLIKRN